MILSSYSTEDLEKELSNRKNFSNNYLVVFITPRYLEIIPIIGCIKDISIYKECLSKSRLSYENEYNLLIDIEDLNNYSLIYHRKRFLDILVDYIHFHSYFSRTDFESGFVIFYFEKINDEIKYKFNKFDIGKLV